MTTFGEKSLMLRATRIFSALICSLMALSLVSTAEAVVKPKDSCQQAVSAVGIKEHVTYVCMGGVANVFLDSGNLRRTFVVSEADHSYREITGKTEAEKSILLGEVAKKSPAGVLTGYVDGLYRGRTEDKLQYGSSGGGGPNFSTSIYFRAIISLQSNNHRFEYFWSQNDNRQIGLSAVIQLKRYIYWPGTDVVADTVPLQNSVYATNDTKYTYLQTSYFDRQIFYYNVTNIKVNDRPSGGSYDISGDIPGPYFQCTVSGGCIYPNAQPVVP